MNNITTTKKPYEYNENVKKVFNLISYKNHEPQITGSNSMKFKYASDYDMFSVVISNKSLDGLKKEVVKNFQYMMKNIKVEDNIYFIEFKCGVDKDGEPLYWTIQQVLQGRNGNYKLSNVLDEKSIIKIEIVAYIDGKFIPFSDVFHFQINDKGINQEKITIDTVESLSKDINKYYKDKNTMKVLKRLFIISNLEKNTKLSENLISIFQSDIGFLYKTKSDIQTIISVLEKYNNKLLIERVHSSLQTIKESLSTQTAHKFSAQVYSTFDKIQKLKSSKSIVRRLTKLTDLILKVVNKLLEKQLRKHKISFKKYLLSEEKV